jgi:hypothetical protein
VWSTKLFLPAAFVQDQSQNAQEHEKNKTDQSSNFRGQDVGSIGSFADAMPLKSVCVLEVLAADSAEGKPSYHGLPHAIADNPEDERYNDIAEKVQLHARCLTSEQIARHSAAGNI